MTWWSRDKDIRWFQPEQVEEIIVLISTSQADHIRVKRGLPDSNGATWVTEITNNQNGFFSLLLPEDPWN